MDGQNVKNMSFIDVFLGLIGCYIAGILIYFVILIYVGWQCHVQDLASLIDVIVVSAKSSVYWPIDALDLLIRYYKS